ncbi:MAG TPA: chromate efflux transporter [Acetobacteraceae bacterium]|nr:chromate efflux transporter [Acetobacteraceae bacterium]
MGHALAELSQNAGTPAEVFRAFLRLGLTSFGGPIAHLGYFRAEFVERRRWLDERSFADIVGLCQFLPGPASSQTGFALGLMRAGPAGALAAWAGFTLPSAVLMVLFAYGAPHLDATRWGAGLLHGLKLVAVAVVAQAVWGMARTLAPDRQRASIAVAAVALALFAPSSLGQVAAIALGALLGLCFCREGAGAVPEPLRMPVSARAGAALLALFAVLLALAFTPAGGFAGLAAAIYRSGALVFGGGHVVLPLLRDAVVRPGFVGEAAFLSGYGAAQAVPGPLFTFAAFLGATAAGVAGAVLALAAIFLPGLLLLTGTLPFWDRLRGHPRMQAALRGVNGAVVGLLGAALYDPVWTGSVRTAADFTIALAAFVLLAAWKAAPVLVVGAAALLGTLLGAAA